MNLNLDLYNIKGRGQCYVKAIEVEPLQKYNINWFKHVNKMIANFNHIQQLCIKPSGFLFPFMEIVRVRNLVDTDLSTCQHRLTHFTCFHGTHRKFYFCVRCSHTLCPLTCINIKGHHALYLTFLKLNLCKYVFVSTFSSVDVNKYYFHFRHMYASGKMCKNMTLSQ